MTSALSQLVQMQYLRPRQLEAAARSFPVVYVPFGCIEWHGQHGPLGTDALKSHGILVKCAEQYGGVVYPPVYFPHAQHNGDDGLIESDRGWKLQMVTELFQRLKMTGFRVIIGVSGHNIQTQMELFNEALKPATADGTIAGVGLWEMSLSQCKESSSDHAAKWETSILSYLAPDLVDLGKYESDIPAKEQGVLGEDPIENASPEVGEAAFKEIVENIAQQALKLLEAE